MLLKLLNRLIAAPVRRPPDGTLARIPDLVSAGRVDEAAAILEARVGADPHDADALHYLGLVRARQGRADEAVRLIQAAIKRSPETAFFHANLAEVYRTVHKLAEAERHARFSVNLDPTNPDFHYNLGNILFQSARYAEALVSARTVLERVPGHEGAVLLAAKACRETGALADAISLFHERLALRPGDVEAVVGLVRCKARACDWSMDILALERLLKDWVAAPADGAFDAVHPFLAFEFPVARDLRDAMATAQVSRIKARLGAAPAQFSFPLKPQRGCIRVGYVSADFHSHPTMHLMRSFFALHDRRRFEVIAYSLGPEDHSEYRRDAVAGVDRFCDIRNEGARESARRIHADGIDILVDLKGFTYEARPEIFLMHPAPLQVAWLGYPASTGEGLNDYVVVDRVVAPPGCEADYGEALVRMPHCYQVNDHLQPIAPGRPDRATLGLPEAACVFACFNHTYKIEPVMFGAWMRILARVEGSVLWLYESNALAGDHLRREARQRGIAPERIVFGGTLPKPEHLARLACADLFLDTLHVNAHTGGSDALWAGLPMLSCPGETFASRVGASLLHAAGLPQLVCNGLQAYEDAAVALAQDADRLRGLRKHLVESRAALPLFDTPRFTRDLERAYDMMWQRHLAGLKPAAFDVGMG